MNTIYFKQLEPGQWVVTERRPEVDYVSMKKSGDIWFVYILRFGPKGKLYCGIAKNFSKRVEDHACGRGAKCLRGQIPQELVYMELVIGKGTALRREAEIKRMTKAGKEKLVQSNRG